MNTLPFSLVLLSWHSPKTLRNTLQSYSENGLLSFTDDIIIYFQEVNETDLAIAEEFGITKILSSASNQGISAGIQSLMQAAKYENILFLEEDWICVEDKEQTYKSINGGIQLLDENLIDFYRYRSINNPGNPWYCAQFIEDPTRSPEHLIEQVYAQGARLADSFPGIMHYIAAYGTETIYGDSCWANYSNNPFMCKKQFWLGNIAPADLGGVSLEGEIRKTWRQSGYRVGHNIPGLFCHRRYDR